MNRRFPNLLGSSAGDTIFNTFEIDSQGNFGVGGSSKDLSLVTTSGSLLIGIFQNQGYNYTWMNELPQVSSAQKVSQILFTSDDQKLISLLSGGGPIQILCFNSFDGTLLNYLNDNGQLDQSTAIMVIHQNFIYLVATTIPANHLSVFVLNIFATNPASFSSSISSFKLTSSSYTPYSTVFIQPSNKIYISAGCLMPTCIALVSLQISYSLPGTFGSFTSPDLSQMTGSYSNPKLTNWADQALFMVAEDQTTSLFGLILLRYYGPLFTSQEGYKYQEGNPDQLNLISLDSLSSTEIFIGFKKSLMNRISIMQVQFNNPAQVKMYILQKPQLGFSELFFIKVKAASNFFFSGKIQSLTSLQTGSCLSVSPGSVAFLSTSNNPDSCFPFSFNIGTSFTSLILNPAVIFSYTSHTEIYATVTFATLPPSVSFIMPFQLYTTLNACCNFEISPTSMPYQKYIIDTPEITYNHPQFQIVSNPCTDFSFTYKSDIVLTPSAATINTSPYILFNDSPSMLSFKVYTIDPSKQGVYNVRLTGYLPNHQFLQGAISVIELFQIPSFEFIIPVAIPDLEYTTLDPALKYKFKPFLQSAISGTYNLLYFLEILTDQNDWSDKLDPNLLIFRNVNQDLSLEVYTTQNLRTEVYTLRLRAKFTLNSVNAVQSQFKLTVINKCQQTVLIPYHIPSIVVNQSYTEGDPLVITQFKKWKDSANGGCGKIQYKLVEINGAQIPYYMEFNKNILTFNIFQRPKINTGTYQLQIIGEIKKLMLSQKVFFNVTINQGKKILHSQLSQLQKYNQSAVEVSQNSSVENFQKAKIVQINEIGIVNIKFQQKIKKVFNYSLINSEVLNITVIKLQNDNRDTTIYHWRVYFMNENLLKIQLSFNRSSDISPSIDIIDQLFIEFHDNPFFISQTQEKGIIRLQKDYLMLKQIPRQLKSKDRQLMEIMSIVSKCITFTTLATASLMYLMPSSLINLLGILNVSQILLVIPLMNIDLPPNAQLIFDYLNQLITLNLGFDVDQVPGYTYLFEFKQNNTEAFSPQFERQNYQSLNMIENMGMGFVQLIFIIAQQLIIALISLFLRYTGRKKYAWYETKENQALFNTTILIFQEGVLEFFICGLINVLNIDFKSNGTEIFSSSFAISVFTCTAIMVIISFKITSQLLKEQQELSFSKRINVIYEGLSLRNIWTINYHTFIVLRKVYLVAIMIFLKDYSLIQILAYYLQSIIFFSYVVFKKPFKDTFHQKLEVFNEVAIFLAAISLPASTSFSDSDGQYNFGWALSGILLITVGVNTIYGLVIQMIELFKVLKNFKNSILSKLSIKKTLKLRPMGVNRKKSPPIILNNVNTSLMRTDQTESQTVSEIREDHSIFYR